MIFSTKYASNKKTQGVGYNYGGFRGSVGMGIPWRFPRDISVGMGWVWGLKSNPHGSPANRPWTRSWDSPQKLKSTGPAGDPPLDPAVGPSPDSLNFPPNLRLLATPLIANTTIACMVFCMTVHAVTTGSPHRSGRA